ncbi:MAG: class I SAM-dependent methyltransferase [Chloroflexi bacterium OHK40]
MATVHAGPLGDTTDAPRIVREVLAQLFGPPEDRGFAVRLWDGSREPATSAGDLPFTLVLRHPGALRRMLLPPSELAMTEAYLRGDFDIEGDLPAATGLADRIATALVHPAALASLVRLRALPRDTGAASATSGRARFAARWPVHSQQRDAVAVRHHYDLGNDFYALWLDWNMVYSCAYFPTGSESLEQAQLAKLDLVCRKLRLAPGERLLDVGCGWGALIIHAARHYGVHALGITLSPTQAALARERIMAAGLTERCAVAVCDYRGLAPAERFDKIASVGMIEHVGRPQLTGYFATLRRHLRPGGLLLNHGIVVHPGAAAPGRLARRLIGAGSFIQRHIFPDGELTTTAEVLAAAEPGGLEVRDVENLREHYVRTLRMWLARLEAATPEAIAMVGEPTFRAWRLYLAASAHRFGIGQIGVVQVLFSRPDATGRSCLPLTRAYLYTS